MKRFLKTAVVGLLAAMAAAAKADINFSGVVVSGSLAPAGSFVVDTHPTAIDFSFNDATVGDIVDPRRSGNIEITYLAASTDALVEDRLVLSVLGALSGSGTIQFTETVQDVATSTIIGMHMVTLNANSQLPYSFDLGFSQPSLNVRVTKSLTLTAPATGENDLANVSLIEQTFRLTPEPASALLMSLAGIALLRRR